MPPMELRLVGSAPGRTLLAELPLPTITRHGDSGSSYRAGQEGWGVGGERPKRGPSAAVHQRIGSFTATAIGSFTATAMCAVPCAASCNLVGAVHALDEKACKDITAQFSSAQLS